MSTALPKLYLARHGDTAGTDSHRHTGRTDLLKASRGSVVNVSSVGGSRVLPDRVAYGTSKAALDYLTGYLAVEWVPDGIRVNAVLHWFTRTEMVQKVLEDRAFERKSIAATPLRRPAEPADVARAVARDIPALRLPARFAVGERVC